MKKKFFILLLTLVIALTCFINTGTAYSENFKDDSANSGPNLEKGFLILDSDLTRPLPDRFRNISTLNISGSAQFTPLQLPNLIKAINSKNLYIVDLRQESHGFLNDLAVSFYSPLRDLNNGFSSEDTLAKENEIFGAIGKGSTQYIYNKRARLLKEITVEKSQIEQNLVKANNTNYILFATKDGSIPTPAVTDSFVNFIKTVPASTHLHFHCDAGEGRTTMFMSMFQMMKESNIKSLDEILKEQLNAGGIVLTTERTRALFLQDFYDYTKVNSKDNFKVPFSVWAAQYSNSTF